MSASGPLPLTGVRVVDVTHEWAGPHACRLLGDFGAEVIKVEYARRIDFMRLGRKDNEAYNHHPRWLQINRSKRSVTLDLKTPEDVAVFRDLVAISDVVVENCRAGVMAGLGLGYDALRRIKPDVIMVSMSALGATGPESHYIGYGGSIEPLTGAQVLTAYGRDERPMRVKEMDVMNGIMGACAVMTALVHRQHTGRGQFVDLSQLETATHGMIGEHLLEYVMNGTQTLPVGNRHPTSAPQGCYRCHGEDNWVALSVRSDVEWRSLCAAIGRTELAADARFATAAGRHRHHDEVDALVEAWTRQRSAADAMRLLQEAGVPAGAVASVADLAKDPHLEAREYFQTSADERRLLFPGMPFRLSGSRAEVRRVGPRLGGDNAYVRCELLGGSPEDLRPLREDDIGTAFDPE